MASRALPGRPSRLYKMRRRSEYLHGLRIPCADGTGLTDIAWAAGTRMDDLVFVSTEVCTRFEREQLVDMEDLER